MLRIKFNNYYLLIIISTVITLGNIATTGSVAGLIITIPQILIVYYLLCVGNYHKALYWHLIFILLSISPGIASGSGEGGQFLTLYNYANFKIFGPVSLSYLTSILMLMLTIKNKRPLSKNGLLWKTYMVMIYFAISGNLIGLFGLFFIEGYSWHSYMSDNIYIGMTLLTLYLILKLINDSYKTIFYRSAIPILSGSIFGAVLGYLGGFTISYGGLDSLPMIPDASYFGVIIIISILFPVKHKILIIASLICYIYLSMLNMGGKTVLIFVVCILSILYLTLFSKIYKNNHKKHIHRIRISVIVIIISSISLLLPIILSNSNSLANHKIQSAATLIGGDMTDVAGSPYIRLAETLNFTYNNRENPIFLLLGRGYGGYFTDELGLFRGLDLSASWPDEVIKTGYFTSAHDTFSEVPLLNGFFGLILLLYLVCLYFKRLQYNYLAFAAVPWLLFTFYFSPSLAMSSLFLLTGAEYNKI